MKRILLILLILVWTLLITSVLNSQWIMQESGTTEELTDVIMLDSVNVIAVGKGRSILKTTDGGNTWENVTIMLSSVVPWNGVAFWDTTNGIVVGEDQVRITKDGGNTWYIQSPPFSVNHSYYCAMFIGPGNIYVGADSGWIYHTVDTGKTWTSEKIANESIRSLFAWTGTYAMGLPIYALTSTSLFISQTFPSVPWTKYRDLVNGLGSEVFDGEFSKGGGHGFIAGVQGDLWEQPIILRKNIPDTLWGNVLNNVGSGTLYGVSSPSEKIVYACGSNGKIIFSDDGGENWQLQKSNVTIKLNAINFYNEAHGFAVGDSGVILSYKKNAPDIDHDTLNFPFKIGNKWYYQGGFFQAP